MDELRVMAAQLMEKELPVVPVVNAGEMQSAPSLANPNVNASCTKSSVREAQSSVLEAPSSNYSLVALRSLANEFLAKVKAKVDQVLFFRLRLKVDVSGDIMRRLGQVLSQLGLKPKLLFGLNVRGRRLSRGLFVRHKVKRVRSNVDGEGVPGSTAAKNWWCF